MRRKKNGPVFQLWATKQQLKRRPKAQATAVTSFVSIKIDKLTGREGLD
jgi:hypothetical protein